MGKDKESGHTPGLGESIMRKWLSYENHLPIQSNPNQNINMILHRHKENNLQVYLGVQETSASRRKSEQE